VSGTFPGFRSGGSRAITQRGRARAHAGVPVAAGGGGIVAGLQVRPERSAGGDMPREPDRCCPPFVPMAADHDSPEGSRS
jgi:hypothetical protein